MTDMTIGNIGTSFGACLPTCSLEISMAGPTIDTPTTSIGSLDNSILSFELADSGLAGFPSMDLDDPNLFGGQLLYCTLHCKHTWFWLIQSDCELPLNQL